MEVQLAAREIAALTEGNGGAAKSDPVDGRSQPLVALADAIVSIAPTLRIAAQPAGAPIGRVGAGERPDPPKRLAKYKNCLEQVVIPKHLLRLDGTAVAGGLGAVATAYAATYTAWRTLKWMRDNPGRAQAAWAYTADAQGLYQTSLYYHFGTYSSYKLEYVYSVFTGIGERFLEGSVDGNGWLINEPPTTIRLVPGGFACGSYPLTPITELLGTQLRACASWIKIGEPLRVQGIVAGLAAGIREVEPVSTDPTLPERSAYRYAGWAFDRHAIRGGCLFPAGPTVFPSPGILGTEAGTGGDGEKSPCDVDIGIIDDQAEGRDCGFSDVTLQYEKYKWDCEKDGEKAKVDEAFVEAFKWVDSARRQFDEMAQNGSYAKYLWEFRDGFSSELAIEDFLGPYDSFWFDIANDILMETWRKFHDDIQFIRCHNACASPAGVKTVAYRSSGRVHLCPAWFDFKSEDIQGTAKDRRAEHLLHEMLHATSTEWTHIPRDVNYKDCTHPPTPPSCREDDWEILAEDPNIRFVLGWKSGFKVEVPAALVNVANWVQYLKGRFRSFGNCATPGTACRFSEWADRIPDKGGPP